MRRVLPFLILALAFSQGAEAKTRKPSKAEVAASEAKAKLDAETAAVRGAAAAGSGDAAQANAVRTALIRIADSPLIVSTYVYTYRTKASCFGQG